MSLKSQGFDLSLKSENIEKYNVGIGDSIETVFDLRHYNIDENSVIVYLDNNIINDEFIIDFINSTITFNTAPAQDVVIAISYIAGKSNTLLEANLNETILLFNALVVNVDAINTASVTLYREKADGNISLFANEYLVPAKAPYDITDGTIVLEPGDKLCAYASALDMLKINLEWKV